MDGSQKVTILAKGKWGANGTAWAPLPLRPSCCLPTLWPSVRLAHVQGWFYSWVRDSVLSAGKEVSTILAKGVWGASGTAWTAPPLRTSCCLSTLGLLFVWPEFRIGSIHG